MFTSLWVIIIEQSEICCISKIKFLSKTCGNLKEFLLEYDRDGISLDNLIRTHSECLTSYEREIIQKLYG